MKFDINTLEFESFKEFLLDNFVSSFSKSSFKIIDILSDIESIYKRQNEIKKTQQRIIKVLCCVFSLFVVICLIVSVLNYMITIAEQAFVIREVRIMFL